MQTISKIETTNVRTQKKESLLSKQQIFKHTRWDASSSGIIILDVFVCSLCVNVIRFAGYSKKLTVRQNIEWNNLWFLLLLLLFFLLGIFVVNLITAIGRFSLRIYDAKSMPPSLPSPHPPQCSWKGIHKSLKSHECWAVWQIHFQQPVALMPTGSTSCMSAFARLLSDPEWFDALSHIPDASECQK